jgi:hypothetical protein
MLIHRVKTVYDVVDGSHHLSTTATHDTLSRVPTLEFDAIANESALANCSLSAEGFTI